jgi:putative transposase
MKAGEFSEEQIIGLLQEAEKGEKSIGSLCREAGVTETTFYRWRRKYGGMSVSDASRLKELERENARLKRLLAERDLEIDALQAFVSKK